MKIFYLIASLMAANVLWYHINVPDIHMKTAAPISYAESMRILCSTQSLEETYTLADGRTNHDICGDR